MRYKRISTIGASLITSLCLLSGLMYYLNQDNTSCPMGTFLCHNTTQCLSQKYWCNQIEDCLYGDDEQDCFDPNGWMHWFEINRTSVIDAVKEIDCDYTDIPPRCMYEDCRAMCHSYSEIPQNLSVDATSIYLYNSSIEYIPMNAFRQYPNILILYLDGINIHEIEIGAFANLMQLYWLMIDNNKISKLLPGHFTDLMSLDSLKANKNRITIANLSDLDGSTSLTFINLSENRLTSQTLKLPFMSTLEEIILDQNEFETIPNTLFIGCPELKSLSMQKNVIRTIEEDTFLYLDQLVELNLAFNKITSVPLNVFRPLKNLTKLQLGYNHLHNLPMVVLYPMTKLHSLDLEDISLDSLEKNAFDVFHQLSYVYFKKFHYCATYAPKAQRCRPFSDGVSSLSHLLDKTLLRTAVWVISGVTCMGNVLVLWGRFTAKDENPVLTIIIRNLAVSDTLMGFYLFIIAVTDMIFRDKYNQVASYWMSSWLCTCLGILAMTSLERL